MSKSITIDREEFIDRVAKRVIDLADRVNAPEILSIGLLISGDLTLEFFPEGDDE